jgi:hypothetical protein
VAAIDRGDLEGALALYEARAVLVVQPPMITSLRDVVLLKDGRACYDGSRLARANARRTIAFTSARLASAGVRSVM